jgi:hypothetical protein
MMIGVVFTTTISVVARSELARHVLREESGLAESELKDRLHADMGVERDVDLKSVIIIFRKS